MRAKQKNVQLCDCGQPAEYRCGSDFECGSCRAKNAVAGKILDYEIQLQRQRECERFNEETSEHREARLADMRQRAREYRKAARASKPKAKRTFNQYVPV